jgi:hypothetical protein
VFSAASKRMGVVMMADSESSTPIYYKYYILIFRLTGNVGEL